MVVTLDVTDVSSSYVVSAVPQIYDENGYIIDDASISMDVDSVKNRYNGITYEEENYASGFCRGKPALVTDALESSMFHLR